MPTLHVIYASTSGHTEFVVGVLASYLRERGVTLTLQRAELATLEDFAKGDVLVLGSGTWNTGGVEGQLNPHMHELLNDRAKDVQLTGRPVTFISLGDERYFYTARCTEYFLRFAQEKGAKVVTPPLVIVNEPYGQEEKIQKWAQRLLESVLQKGVANTSVVK